VEVLPYHSFGIYKWKELNLEYKLDDVEQPTKERVQNAQAILEIEKYDGYKK
jgi:pyruvate formate lyase activating enzyme